MRASFVRSRLLLGAILLPGLIVASAGTRANAAKPINAGTREALIRGTVAIEAAFGKVEVDLRRAGLRSAVSPRARRAALPRIAAGHRRPPSLGHRGVHLSGRFAGAAVGEPRGAGLSCRGGGRRKASGGPVSRAADNDLGGLPPFHGPRGLDALAAATGGNWCGISSAMGLAGRARFPAPRRCFSASRRSTCPIR